MADPPGIQWHSCGFEVQERNFPSAATLADLNEFAAKVGRPWQICDVQEETADSGLWLVKLYINLGEEYPTDLI